MGGRPIDYAPYITPAGRYQCPCGSNVGSRAALHVHWARHPDHHPYADLPRIHSADYRLPDGRYQCRCGGLYGCSDALRVHWLRKPACDPRQVRPWPRLDQALRLARVGVCPACLLSLGDHAQCRGCCRWLCAEETDFTRVCIDCAMEWAERPRRQQPAQRRPGRKAA